MPRSALLVTCIIAATHAIPNLSFALWSDASVRELTEASINSGFMTALANGTMTEERFARYVAQHKLMLEAVAQAYALRLARIPKNDTEAITAVAKLLKGVVALLRWQKSYVKHWGLDKEQVWPLPETQAYGKYLRATGDDDRFDMASTAAAVLPYMHLHHHLGQKLISQSSTEDAEKGVSPYQDWLNTHATSRFKALVIMLENFFDTYAQREHAVRFREQYIAAMRHEVEVIDAFEEQEARKRKQNNMVVSGSEPYKYSVGARDGSVTSFHPPQEDVQDDRPRIYGGKTAEEEKRLRDEAFAAAQADYAAWAQYRGMPEKMPHHIAFGTRLPDQPSD